MWFDAVSPDGTEHTSSYVAINGELLTASCGGITVRPTGGNSTWPPIADGGEPGGFHISTNVTGFGLLEVDVTHKTPITSEPPALYRWIGTVSGGFGNDTTWSGPALYEQFAS